MWVLTLMFILGEGDDAHFRTERQAYATQAECRVAQLREHEAYMRGDEDAAGWRLLVGPLPCDYVGAGV